MPERSIEYVPLDELLLAERNPKRHDLSAIDRSVGRWGYTEPVVLDERTGRLVAGHGRVETLQARRERGESPPDGVSQVDGGAWAVPVVRGWASRSDADADAYLLAANRTGELGGWDNAELAEMLSGMVDVDDLLPATGFTQDDLGRLLAGRASSAAPEEFPEYDESIPTQYTCPKCAYSWSGQPAPVETAESA